MELNFERYLKPSSHKAWRRCSVGVGGRLVQDTLSAGRAAAMLVGGDGFVDDAAMTTVKLVVLSSGL